MIWLIFLFHIFIPYSSLASPSIETESDQDSFNLNHRRSSSGGLLSPEVETTAGKGGPGLNETNESDGFYLLKKDSQRRVTLSKVLTNDETKICAVWMDQIENNNKGEVVISIVRLLIVS